MSGASPDVPLDSADRFYGQHHLSLTLEGNLQIFDNQRSEALAVRGDARVLELELDTTSLPGTASRVREQPLSLECPGQGSAFILNPEAEPADRHLLADCTGEGSIVEYDGGGRLVWQVDLVCPSGGATSSMYRAVPLASMD